jgi:hypothetical protein
MNTVTSSDGTTIAFDRRTIAQPVISYSCSCPTRKLGFSHSL